MKQTSNSIRNRVNHFDQWSRFAAARIRILAIMILVTLCASTMERVNAQGFGVNYEGNQRPIGQAAIPQSSAIDRILNAETNSSTTEAGGVRYDNQVRRTGYDQTPLTREPSDTLRNTEIAPLRPAAALASSDQGKPNFIEREKVASAGPTESEAQPKKKHFGQLIANLGMNLAFVLLLGIGFIVIAKQWVKPQSFAKTNAETESTSSLEVKEELVLDGKTKLRVVRWKESDVLIASDSDGVKSMVALAPSFAESLGQIEESEQASVVEQETRTGSRLKSASVQSDDTDDSSSRGVDDRLIQMLLESANRSAKASKSYQRKGST